MKKTGPRDFFFLLIFPLFFPFWFLLDHRYDWLKCIGTVEASLDRSCLSTVARPDPAPRDQTVPARRPDLMRPRFNVELLPDERLRMKTGTKKFGKKKGEHFPSPLKNMTKKGNRKKRKKKAPLHDEDLLRSLTKPSIGPFAPLNLHAMQSKVSPSCNMNGDCVKCR